MNENDNHQDAYIEQAPSSLMSGLLAHLKLDRPEPAPVASLTTWRADLNSSDWTVRIAAVQQLADVKSQEAFRLLSAALHDEDGSVRACAIRVLGMRSDLAKHVALEQLETALHDSEWHVRETAIYTLAALGNPAALIALRDALHDSDDAVRHAALKAIQHLQDTMDTNKSIEKQHAAKPDLSSSQPFIRTWPQNIDRVTFHLKPHVSTTTEKDENMFAEKQNTQITYPPMKPARKLRREKLKSDRPQPRIVRVLEQALAVALILAILIGWFALSHLSLSSSGSLQSRDTRPLGKPISLMQSNFTGIQEWSPDGQLFTSLQIDARKHELVARIFHVTTGRSDIYSVLDASWQGQTFAGLYNIQILQGRYLVALRAHGTHQAILELWDIIGQRAMTTQTVPALLSQDDEILLPQIAPSDNQQRFAVYFPGGTVEIWNVASNQKQVTCEGNIPPGQPPFAFMKWYNHDHSLLLSSSNPAKNKQIEGCNTETGARLFNLNDPSKVYNTPWVSPDNKYLALTIGHQQTNADATGVSSSFASDTLEILDAHSGHILHSYRLNSSSISFSWLPDSQRLLTITQASTPSSSSEAIRASTWNIFTNQVTSFASFSPDGQSWSTPDGSYVILGTLDGRTMKIWQTSSGRPIATIKTPGLPARSDAFFALGNQYLVIGEAQNFSIWSIATGTLLYTYHGATPFSLYGQSGSVVAWSPNEKYLFMIAGKTPSIGQGSLTIWRMP